MLVSVIVPVYQVEKYLPKCVESILKQTYRNLEIILVDDGSPDGCPAICDTYAARDPRIKVIHKPNGGLSAARNSGLEAASGDWIAFVDSDDCVEPTYIETLLNLALKHRCQLAQVGMTKVDESYRTLSPVVKECTESVVRYPQLMEIYYKRGIISTCVWDKLFDKRLFDTARFPVGQTMEDAHILMDILPLVTTGIAVSQSTQYYYLMRPGSILHRKLSVNHQRSSYRVIEKQIDYARKIGNEELLKIALNTLLSGFFQYYRLAEAKGGGNYPNPASITSGKSGVFFGNTKKCFPGTECTTSSLRSITSRG